MKVSELIEKLKECPGDMEVFLPDYSTNWSIRYVDGVTEITANENKQGTASNMSLRNYTKRYQAVMITGTVLKED